MLPIVFWFKHLVSSNLGIHKQAMFVSDKQQDSDNKGSKKTVEYEGL